jgi:hypothetical protein
MIEQGRRRVATGQNCEKRGRLPMECGEHRELRRVARKNRWKRNEDEEGRHRHGGGIGCQIAKGRRGQEQAIEQPMHDARCPSVGGRKCGP